MIKRWILFGVFLISSMSQGVSQEKKLNIVASASMITDMTRQVVGNLHNVETIVPIGGDPHLYEPTPGDARLVNAADLILINGLSFEGWINELIENSGTKAKVITVTEGIDVLVSQTYTNSVDPHAWMSATNGIVYVENIGKALTDLDPSNASTYSKNMELYKGMLSDLDDYIQTRIDSIPEEKRILITSHDAFQYYGQRYGIRLEAIMGISTEAQAQTSDIMRVNRAIRQYNIPAIFIESTINPKLMEQLASDNNVRIGGKLYADSLGDKNSPASTYIDMLKYNTDTIADALKGIGNLNYETDKKSGLKPFIWIGLLSIAILLIVLYKINR